MINEVIVTYYTLDDIITVTTKQLTTELDQQNRNKELKRGHICFTLIDIICLH